MRALTLAQERDFFRLAAFWLELQRRQLHPPLRPRHYSPCLEQIGQLDQMAEMALLLREARSFLSGNPLVLLGIQIARSKRKPNGASSDSV
jgi:hypothetical protein